MNKRKEVKKRLPGCVCWICGFAMWKSKDFPGYYECEVCDNVIAKEKLKIKPRR